MGIQESGASRRNTIHGRRRDSATVSPYAWFQIIDRDEEDVKLFPSQLRRSEDEAREVKT